MKVTLEIGCVPGDFNLQNILSLLHSPKLFMNMNINNIIIII